MIKLERNKLLFLGMMIGALILGGAAGSQVVGPRILAARASKAAGAATGTDAGAAASKQKQGQEHAAAEVRGPVFQLENVIVNPAGSEGTRFLMASVAFEVPDAKSDALLRENEVRARDEITALLSAQRMELLVQPYARDSLKQMLGEAVAPLAGNPAWIRVYLPQFVLQ
ncbi:MAG: flagellar basal body-associated protein FliL [Candidatus Eisenbacteria bacterium]|nr:flagellar basal body-associated FliL family protein [Candidatus Eisenbacteria bacterium]